MFMKYVISINEQRKARASTLTNGIDLLRKCMSTEYDTVFLDYWPEGEKEPVFTIAYKEAADQQIIFSAGFEKLLAGVLSAVGEE